jgi:uncharacterized small protein (DUF1192 family)
MFDEENIKKPEKNSINRNLEMLSLHELTQYIKDLEEEIERVRADILRKKGVLSAAESLFK